VRYRRPLDDFDEAVFNPADDIFAFGSICYEILTGRPPYPELDDEKVKLQFSLGSFPETKQLGLGHVIRNCWEGHFVSFEAILTTIQREK
jgi:serine/threonine protein kinase